MIECDLLSSAIVNDLALGKHGFAHHPGANRQAGKLRSVPRAPTTLGKLIRVSNRVLLIKVDEH